LGVKPSAPVAESYGYVTTCILLFFEISELELEQYGGRYWNVNVNVNIEFI